MNLTRPMFTTPQPDPIDLELDNTDFDDGIEVGDYDLKSVPVENDPPEQGSGYWGTKIFKEIIASNIIVVIISVIIMLIFVGVFVKVCCQMCCQMCFHQV
jgi:hypothetical protein